MNVRSLAVLAAALAFSSTVTAQTTVLTGATVIDGTGAGPQKDITIVMEGGRIREMGPASRITIPAGAEVVKLAGKFIVPGIINAHGHVANPDPELRQYALYGITTAVSQGTDSGDQLVKARQEQLKGNVKGARVMTTLYRFEPRPDVTTPEQARAKVDEIVGRGADLVKVWVESNYGAREKISPEISRAVLEQSRKHGKVTTAHIYELADARMMIEAGLNVLAHSVRDQEVDAAFIALVKERNVSLIPTLTRDEGLTAYAFSPSWIEEPFFRKSVPDERMQVLRGKVKEAQLKDPLAPRIKAGFEMNKHNLKRLSDAGARIAFGTDSGGPANRFFVQGYFEHREMLLMVESGLTPMQVIQAFSKGSAEALRIDKDYGTLAAGKVADLLVLERNPLENISNMRTIQTIYMGGRKYE